MNHFSYAFLLFAYVGIVVAQSAVADPPKTEPKPTGSAPQDAKVDLSSSALEALVKPCASREELETLASVLERTYSKTQPPESVRMLIAIARGSQMGPGSGWFGPAQSRFS